MKTIIVTGGIGGGKSEVCRYLATKGFPVYDSDSRVKSLYDEVPGLWNYIKAKFEIKDRWELADLIFNDAKSREELESIVYPILKDDFLDWRDSRKEPFCVFESAVATDKPFFDDIADIIVFVDCPEEIRIERAAARDKTSRDSIAMRMRSQVLAPEKADYIIENDSDLYALRRKTDEIIANFVKENNKNEN